MSIFALVLLLASFAAWIVAGGAKPGVGVFVRFTAVLYTALAAGSVLGTRLTDAVAFLVTALAPAILALAVTDAFGRRVPPALSALLLTGACLAGFCAAATGAMIVALVPLAIAAVAMIVIGFRHLEIARGAAIRLMVSACAFLAAASCYMSGDMASLLLFSAVGLLGVALALASGALVQQKRGHDFPAAAAIRRTR